MVAKNELNPNSKLQMKAVVFERYGSPSVLEFKDVEKPEPKKDEILVKVHATSVGYGDILLRKGIPRKEFNMPFPLYLFTKLYFRIRGSKNGILGGDCSGIVETVGENVTKFKPGDEVFVYIGQSMRGNAEYVCLSEKRTIAIKPNNISFEEVAPTSMGGLMASTIINRLDVKTGQKVLVLGASGGIGHFAVQYFKMYGAEVTGVCSTARVDLVKSLGADHVIDYKLEDWTKNGEVYDIIFDVIHRTSFKKAKKSLTPNGRYILPSFGLKNFIHMFYRKIRGGKQVLCMMAREGGEHLTAVKEDIEEGKIKSIVDKSFPLEKAAEAHTYIENGNKKGHVVLTLDRLQ